jgi:hypothetical protein
MGANPLSHAAVGGIQMLWLVVQGVLVLPISFSLLTIGPSYIPALEVALILLLGDILTTQLRLLCNVMRYDVYCRNCVGTSMGVARGIRKASNRDSIRRVCTNSSTSYSQVFI